MNGSIWPNIELSLILWMSSLPACIRKIQSKIKSLLIGHFPYYQIISLWELIFHHSRASTCNSKVNIPIQPKFKLRQDFMLALVTCKFDENLIKIEGIIDRTMSNTMYWLSLELKGR